ncbi:MAG: hypothetical protein EHM47_17680 [Ignavibacteriales bacterium]|nr:MAG: hypothetical protein EHM47_17680 [Ignavibacteriales bacterium]
MKGSQCPGEHTFQLSLYPHKGNWIEGKVFSEALKFNYDLKAVQSGNGNGALPSSASFISIDSQDVIMSCFKKSEDYNAYILRLYNPSSSDIDTHINTFFKITNASIVSLEEKFLSYIPQTEDNRIHINISKKKILTLKLSFSS